MKPEIKTEEDCKTLTDRWGDALDPINLTAEERFAISALLPSMYDEFTFIAQRGGVFGLLFEVEFDDGLQPTERDANAVQLLTETYPRASFWLTQGDHTFSGRVAARAFLPADAVTPEFATQLGAAFTAILPAPADMVTIPLSVAKQIAGDLASHMEDWGSGMDDGTYDRDAEAKASFAESEKAATALDNAIAAVQG